MPGLNAGRLAVFLDQGYLLLEDALPDEALRPLVDATEENGCLEVMRGSHRLGLRPHGKVAGYPNAGILEGHVPAGDTASCPVRKSGLVRGTGCCPRCRDSCRSVSSTPIGRGGTSLACF